MGRQSGFAQLMLACAGLVKEVRLSIEDQQEKASKREATLIRERDAALKQVTEQKEMGGIGITLNYVQSKVLEAAANRDALYELANKTAPCENPNTIGITYRTMPECLVALKAIKLHCEFLHAHIAEHTKAPNLEQEIVALIDELAPHVGGKL